MADFRFEGEEVFIRKDTDTGEIILSSKPDPWDEFLAALDEGPDPVRDDYMCDRGDLPAFERDLF